MTEELLSIKALERTLRQMEDHRGRKADAIIPLEIGGINSALQLVLSAKTGIPAINADGMGRAFPEIQMVTFSVTVFGFKALDHFSLLVVSLLIIFMFCMVYFSMQNCSIEQLMLGTTDTSISVAISVVVGSYIVGATLIPDLCH